MKKMKKMGWSCTSGTLTRGNSTRSLRSRGRNELGEKAFSFGYSNPFPFSPFFHLLARGWLK